MSSSYQIQGEDRLAATLKAAGDELGDLTAINARAGDTVLAAARTRAPVRTGRLVASLFTTVDAAGVQVGAGVSYAPYVHAANPFLTDALTKSTPTVIGYYSDAVNAAVDGVTGA